MLAQRYVQQAAQQYRTAQVAAADPGRLVLMLYDGALRFAERGRQAIAEGNIELANAQIGRVQDIVAELTGVLDLSAGEIAANLQQMYDFIARRLVEANVKKEAAPLAEAVTMLEELRQTWQQVVEGDGGVTGDPNAGSKTGTSVGGSHASLPSSSARV